MTESKPIIWKGNFLTKHLVGYIGSLQVARLRRNKLAAVCGERFICIMTMTNTALYAANVKVLQRKAQDHMDGVVKEMVT